ncbi:MAG: beta-phosphoglucomutase [Clostridiales bacterium]|nr:beta-phosphoglucomutase [Clostridiales bacterium]
MKYKGIIFDLDGVICHTDKYHYKAWKQLADKLDIYFDEQINNRLRGVSRMDSLEIILERYAGAPLSQEEKVQLATEKNEIYKKLLMEMSPKDLSDEVKATLESLRKLGLKLAIGSSSRNARLILSRIGLEDFFDGISDGNNISKSKPDPEVFLKAAAMVDLKPSECLVIEDAKAGIDAAHNGGMDSAGIGDAAGYPLASYSLAHFNQITDFLF